MKKTAKKLVLLRETLRPLENVAGGAKTTTTINSLTGAVTCCDYTYSCPEWSCICTR